MGKMEVREKLSVSKLGGERKREGRGLAVLWVKSTYSCFVDWHF